VRLHKAKSGLCFPNYEKIAEGAGCARSTVAEAIKPLEDAGSSHGSSGLGERLRRREDRPFRAERGIRGETARTLPASGPEKQNIGRQ
jgi:hypothetical protein